VHLSFDTLISSSQHSVEHLDTLLRNRQTVNYCQRAGYKQFTGAPRSVVCLVMTLFSAIGEYQSFRFRDHVTAPQRAGVEVSGGGSSRPGVATQQHQQLLMSIHLYCCISLSLSPVMHDDSAA